MAQRHADAAPAEHENTDSMAVPGQEDAVTDGSGGGGLGGAHPGGGRDPVPPTHDRPGAPAWGHNGPMGLPSQPWQQGFGAGPPIVTAPPPRRTNTALIVALSAAALVVVVVVALVVVAARGGGGSADSPQEAVKGYLEALARGDASAALAFGLDQPGSTDLLTDDILSQQIAKWPITDIKILDGDTSAPVGGVARVHVSAKFGDHVSDATLVAQERDGWKLQHATVKIDNQLISGKMKALDSLTVFGAAAATNPVYVFPGWIDTASSNPNMTVSTRPLLLKDLNLTASGVVLSDAKFELSDGGRQAIMSAVEQALAACTNSNLLRPPGCPLRVETADLVEGTAKWGQVDDLSGVQLSFNPFQMDVMIIGTVRASFSAQKRSGAVAGGNIAGFLNGTADMTHDPPTVTFR